jgi:hypothetical protein
LLEKKNPVVMTKERFYDQQIGLVLFRQLAHGPFISCESANSITQIALENCSKSFSGDGAVVSDNYRRLSRGERSGGGPHKFESAQKLSAGQAKFVS